ncbi:MAG: DUF2207 domain-containing protein [Pseudomonadota bacterium]
MLFTSLIVACLSTAAAAEEKINTYDVDIIVKTDGDILVTERIDVTVEGRQIRRGIFRDLPRFYEKSGTKLPFRYRMREIKRDGEDEPYEKTTIDNAVRWRIGDADVLLDHGRHVYEITYLAENQIRFFDNRDELYWNAIGQYWAFPIDSATVNIVMPDGARAFAPVAYTGAFGEQGGAYSHEQNGSTHSFQTTSRLEAENGMSVSISMQKGLIDPPSASDLRKEWWAANGALLILIAGAIGITGFHFSAWRRVGVDPQKGPVFPRYEPPEGYSPAGVHYIYYRSLNGHKALIASILNLAINNWITISDVNKKSTTLSRPENTDDAGEAFPAEKEFLSNLLSQNSKKTIGGKPDTTFTKAYQRFQKTVGKRFGSDYFKWNFGYIAIAIALSVGAIGLAAATAISWSVYMTLGVGVLIIVNVLFAYLLPAPTIKGQEIRTAIEGFRLYLKTAEKLQLNAADTPSGAPPAMSRERYERFLPYAVALDVEKPWTKHFEKLVPEEAASYAPHWSRVSGRHYNSLHGLNSALVSSLSSGVSSALPQSSGSSGSGGGGFSGGGGGGGGGGGW